MSPAEQRPDRRERAGLDSFDSSLANLGELLVALLEAAGGSSVLEVGAEHGHLTTELLAWAAGGDGRRVVAIDPEAQPRLLELAAAAGPGFELIRARSLEALAEVELADAIVLDGDHNHHTLSGELRLIAERAPEARLPLLLLHDVGWPLARRDSYHAPEQIPAQHRQPLAREALLTPCEPGVAEHGLPAGCVAAREGGPANGVLTAAEDFVAADQGLRLAIVPAFFGLGVIWHRDAPWAQAVATAVGPWDRNPVLARLEQSRIDHLVAEFANAAAAADLRARGAERDRLLRAMLDSSAFALAERISRLRQGGEPVFSRERVRRALDDPDASSANRTSPRNDTVGDIDPAE